MSTPGIRNSRRRRRGQTPRRMASYQSVRAALACGLAVAWAAPAWVVRRDPVRACRRPVLAAETRVAATAARGATAATPAVGRRRAGTDPPGREDRGPPAQRVGLFIRACPI